MKRFRVTVNGQPFEVTVEEHGSGGNGTQPVRLPGPPAPPVQTPQAAPRTPAAAAPAPTAPAAATGRGAVTAPLPGMIVAVKVEAGQSVSAGQVLLVLEAMKMENDVVAPHPGVVREVLVAPGATVAGGQPLVVLD